jgi:hypothetical protein
MIIMELGDIYVYMFERRNIWRLRNEVRDHRIRDPGEELLSIYEMHVHSHKPKTRPLFQPWRINGEGSHEPPVPLSSQKRS